MSVRGRDFLNQYFFAVNTLHVSYLFHIFAQELKRIDFNLFKNTKAPLQFNQKILYEFCLFSDGSYLFHLKMNEAQTKQDSIFLTDHPVACMVNPKNE